MSPSAPTENNEQDITPQDGPVWDRPLRDGRTVDGKRRAATGRPYKRSSSSTKVGRGTKWYIIIQILEIMPRHAHFPGQGPAPPLDFNA